MSEKCFLSEIFEIEATFILKYILNAPSRSYANILLKGINMKLSLKKKKLVNLNNSKLESNETHKVAGGTGGLHTAPTVYITCKKTNH